MKQWDKDGNLLKLFVHKFGEMYLDLFLLLLLILCAF